ncbi:RsmG family class I SAM-dependent methyltransferase [Rhodohalobacter mucosus]|uniref:RsmG family class I SAM-dependent methyltransferase n=1 Tax=Rhodohalobacter mucosus TaxID=2079485 RepID=UPI001304A394|nr:RsmG family class I SAM-dependent methyltransferase [Rhodohalobacter mucosus]
MKQSVKEVNIGLNVLEDAVALYNKHAERLEEYTDLLLGWNDKINLVSRNVSRETLKEHIIHSLIPAGMGLLKSHDRWIDTGSGGGLPGIPLAICEGQKKWILNDNVRKKMRVAQDIIDTMSLENCSVAAKSISLFDLAKGDGIVTKHAFKVDDLIRLLGKKPWQTILMWKGAEEALKEVKSVGKNMNVTLYRFEFGKMNPFYEGKALLLLKKK